MTPEQRTIRARAGAHAMHARNDSRQITAKARAVRAEMARFERQADPDRILAPEERRRRARHLQQAELARLALKASLAQSRWEAAEEWRREAGS